MIIPSFLAARSVLARKFLQPIEPTKIGCVQHKEKAPFELGQLRSGGINKAALVIIRSQVNKLEILNVYVLLYTPTSFNFKSLKSSKKFTEVYYKKNDGGWKADLLLLETELWSLKTTLVKYLKCSHFRVVEIISFED